MESNNNVNNCPRPEWQLPLKCSTVTGWYAWWKLHFIFIMMAYCMICSVIFAYACYIKLSIPHTPYEWYMICGLFIIVMGIIGIIFDMFFVVILVTDILPKSEKFRAFTTKLNQIITWIYDHTILNVITSVKWLFHKFKKHVWCKVPKIVCIRDDKTGL